MPNGNGYWCLPSSKRWWRPLKPFFPPCFSRRGGIIHGGITIKKRKETIDKFQDRAYCPFLVLSLRAGGTGLNLTRANHVIHF